MSVLIKGMKMPRECYECDFVQYGGEDWCYITEQDLPCDCPLFELPDHGDLVDVDLLKAECKEPNVWWETEYQMGYILAAAQVIIPAERSEDATY